MIVMTFTIELDIPLSYLLQPALPLASDRSRDNTHRRGRSKRSYGHCRRRTEIPEAAFDTPQAGEASFPVSAVMFVDAALPASRLQLAGVGADRFGRADRVRR
jgi:hypothetical protein